jgi:hypothetical protein
VIQFGFMIISEFVFSKNIGLCPSFLAGELFCNDVRLGNTVLGRYLLFDFLRISLIPFAESYLAL